VRSGIALECAALASMAAAHSDPRSLACGQVRAELTAVLAREPVGTVIFLLNELSSCVGAHRICGVVYDQSQTHAHVFTGETTSDVPGLEYYEGGASYALMAARSFPPSRKSHFTYCLALTPGEGKSDRPFDWHGWMISPKGEVRALDLSNESTAMVRTNPRSMAAALWNLYASMF